MSDSNKEDDAMQDICNSFSSKYLEKQSYNNGDRTSDHEMQYSESFFVSDTMDDESLIIPPTPMEAIEANADVQESMNMIDETLLLVDERESSRKEIHFGRVDDEDDDEEDEWTKPTQPLFSMKQDEEPQIIGPSDDEEDNDETFVGEESILGPCYDLPTQRNTPPDKETVPSQNVVDDKWNLQLTQSQNTQGTESLPVLEQKANGSSQESESKDENSKPVEDADQNIETLDMVETIKVDHNAYDALYEEKDMEDDDERDKTPSPSKFSEKESTPEDISLFAAIESIVNAAKAESKSSLAPADTPKQITVDPSADKSYNDDEIAPTQNPSQPTGMDRECMKATSEGHASQQECEKNIPATKDSPKDELSNGHTTSKKASEDVSKKVNSGTKKTNRLTKKPLKKLQEKCESEPSNNDGEPGGGSCNAENLLDSTVQSYQSPSKKKALDPLLNKDSETPHLDTQILEGAAEVFEKTSVSLSSSDILGPPLAPKKSYRTPQKKKSGDKFGLKSEGSFAMEPPINLKSSLKGHKRILGSFTDQNGLESALLSLGFVLEKEKLKAMFSPYRRSFEKEVVKRKVVQRIYVKDNEILEELQPVDDVHARIDISPLNSSSTTSSTKTSSFVSSGDMGDISSSISSKSLSSSASSVLPEVKGSQEDGKLFKLPFESSDVLHQMHPSSNTSFGDRVSSQDDFKNPVVVISPIKPSKRVNVKKNSTDSPKSKKRRKPLIKTEALTTESSDAESQSKKEDAQDVQAAAKPQKKSSSKKKTRTDTKRQVTKKRSVAERSAATSNGLETGEDLIDVPDIEEDSNNDPSPFGSILPGVRVMARWKDGYYYPGKVTRQEVDGRWEVRFDDGAIRIVIQDSLLKIPVLQPGTSVLALSPDGYYDPGIVCSFYRDGKNSGYVIEQKSGLSRRYERANVILSTEQAKLIINQRPVAPPSLTINLDNIIGGKRKRKSSGHQRESSSSPTPKSPRISRRKHPDPNLDTTASSASESVVATTDSVEIKPLDEVPVKKGQKRASAKSKNSKSSKGKKAKKNKKQSPENSEISSETSVPESSASREIAPIRTSKLFLGHAFLLTYSNKKSENDEEVRSCDKEHLCHLILSGGGIIYDTFEDMKKNTKRKVILLASKYVRTIKYLQCVAANIPCVQHYWIQNCVLTRNIVEYGTYLLPTGYSITHGAPIQWHGNTDIFNGMKIVITADKKQGKDFVNLWTPVLLAAKADLVQKWNIPSFLEHETAYEVDLIVTNNTCPANILEAAKRRKIPVVSSEYIIQCIIVGSKLQYDGHEKFRHDFVA